jgi:non-ribosomal peptide synthetase component F
VGPDTLVGICVERSLEMVVGLLGILKAGALDPAAPPIRPQRHVPNSIATVHQILIVALARILPRCPCCARKAPPNMRRNL